MNGRTTMTRMRLHSQPSILHAPAADAGPLYPRGHGALDHEVEQFFNIEGCPSWQHRAQEMASSSRGVMCCMAVASERVDLATNFILQKLADVKRVTEDMAATLQRSGHSFTGFYGEDEIGTPFQPG
ncbi:hypothetical protein WJX75_000133 [Coccomyxa subellipsoidea]|uniref:Uncharacterized protein n=1 Tax=Coccomyxa subellipsoidea TaxID=248742 RepID=A0ABR2YZE4_9CHLO